MAANCPGSKETENKAGACNKRSKREEEEEEEEEEDDDDDDEKVRVLAES